MWYLWQSNCIIEKKDYSLEGTGDEKRGVENEMSKMDLPIPLTSKFIVNPETLSSREECLLVFSSQTSKAFYHSWSSKKFHKNKNLYVE